jgi:hypothetical protein
MKSHLFSLKIVTVLLVTAHLTQATTSFYLVVVQNPNSIPLVNYQVKVPLPKELYGKNLLLVDNVTKPLDFCYETYTGSCIDEPEQGNGNIWVRVPYVEPHGKFQVYILVGPNGATNGDRVFYFYEDFNSEKLTKSWDLINFTLAYRDCCFESSTGMAVSTNHQDGSIGLLSIVISLPSNGTYLVESRLAVSSELYHDWFIFKIDNETIVQLSGNETWGFFSAKVSGGNHSLTFEYSKDRSLSIGCDRGYVDFIRIRSLVPQEPVVLVAPLSEDVLEQTVTRSSYVMSSTQVRSISITVVPSPSLIVILLLSVSGIMGRRRYGNK